MRFPEYPEPMGVVYRVKADCYEDHVEAQVQFAVKNRGRGTIEQLLYSGDTWEVEWVITLIDLDKKTPCEDTVFFVGEFERNAEVIQCKNGSF